MVKILLNLSLQSAKAEAAVRIRNLRRFGSGCSAQVSRLFVFQRRGTRRGRERHEEVRFAR